MFENFKSNMRIVLRTWSGRIGVALLLLQAILALYAVAAYYPAGMTMYEQARQTYYPFYYPNTAPPCWAVNDKFPTTTLTKSDVKESYQVTTSIPEDLRVVAPDVYSLLSTQFQPLMQAGLYKLAYASYEGTIDLTGTGLPSDVRLLLAFKVPSEFQANGTVLINSAWMYIERPDGLVATIFYAGQLYKPGAQNITHTVIVYGFLTKEANATGHAYTNSLTDYKSNPYLGPYLGATLKTLYNSLGVPIENRTGMDPRILFATSENGTLAGLPGTYKVRIGIYSIVLSDYADMLRESMGIEDFELRLMGNCYGFFGTDTYSRPISLGLLLGLPYAFLLGFTVTFISTFIGAIYGTVAGYWKDIKGEGLMRVADVVLSLPFLPILIAISFSFGTIDLMKLALLMIALFWASPVIVVRSMSLQISEQLYIEAAKAVGTPSWKIIFKHIFPQIYPYAMAIAVLSIPGIIVTEASLAVLGFGDPTAPTWGKMLELAYEQKAVTGGWWWMYIFPGLALVVFSATFLLVGRAVEPLVAPKLQK